MPSASAWPPSLGASQLDCPRGRLLSDVHRTWRTNTHRPAHITVIINIALSSSLRSRTCGCIRRRSSQDSRWPSYRLHMSCVSMFHCARTSSTLLRLVSALNEVASLTARHEIPHETVSRSDSRGGAIIRGCARQGASSETHLHSLIELGYNPGGTAYVVKATVVIHAIDS